MASLQSTQNVVPNNTASVTVEAGPNYCNWLKISKLELKQRDTKLLEIKSTNIEKIVNQQLKSKDYSINQETINNTLQILSHEIEKWKGINIQRTKKNILTYKQYFTIARNSCDQRKRKLFGNIFWLFVFKGVQKKVQNINDSFIFARILKALFNGSIEYRDTKTHSLINIGTLINSSEMQTFLYNFHKSITIPKWIKESENCRQKATIIGDKIRNSLHLLTSAHKHKSHTNIVSTNVLNVPSPILPARSMNGPNHNRNNNAFLSSPQYSSSHNTAYSTHSADIRYSPLTHFPSLPSINMQQNVNNPRLYSYYSIPIPMAMNGRLTANTNQFNANVNNIQFVLPQTDNRMYTYQYLIQLLMNAQN